MKWKFYSSFHDIPASHVYDILKLRQDVFIVEQNCIYEDIDKIDFGSEHLLLLINNTLCGYLRIVPAGKKFPEISIGRIVISKIHRGHGHGKALISKAIKIINEKFPQPVRIEAQAHLESFYTRLGFSTECRPYDLDGIPHIEMLHEKQ